MNIFTALHFDKCFVVIIITDVNQNCTDEDVALWTPDNSVAWEKNLESLLWCKRKTLNLELFGLASF